MDDKPASRESRREEIGRRLAAIRARMDELKRVRQDDASAAAVRERIGSAQRQAAASRAAAEHAIAASIRAFRRSAQAHERAALQQERAAAAGFGDKDQHEQQAIRHRAAAAADTLRAERAQSLLGDQKAEDARRSDLDQALRLLTELRVGIAVLTCWLCLAVRVEGTEQDACQGGGHGVPDNGYLLMINGVVVVPAPAEIGIANTEQLRVALLAAGSRRHWTVDMTGTRFCDSSGFSALVAAHKYALAEGGGLRPSPGGTDHATPAFPGCPPGP